MKSLLIEDYYSLKSSIWVLGIIAVIYSMLFSRSIGWASASVLSCFVFTYGITESSLKADYKSNWIKYAAILPVKKSAIILNKYIVIFLSALISISISVGIYFLSGYFFGSSTDVNFPENISFLILVTGFSLVLIMCCTTVDLCFCFGLDKLTLASIIVIFVTLILLFTAQTLSLNFSFILNLSERGLLIGELIFTSLYLVISYLITVNIFKRREI